MAYFVDPFIDEKPRSVGVIEDVIIAPVDARGQDHTLVVVTNSSATETFNGRVSSSPNGRSQWSDVPDDSFQSVGPGVSRTMTLDSAQHLFVRLKGNFVGAPDTLTVTVVRLRAASRRA